MKASEVPIGTREQRRQLLAAINEQISTRRTRGALRRAQGTVDALLFALLPQGPPGLTPAALRDFIGYSSAMRQGRILTESLERLRKAGVLLADPLRHHWRSPGAEMPVMPTKVHDAHEDVRCVPCGACIGQPCRGAQGQVAGAHKRRVRDSKALRAEREQEREREAAWVQAAAFAASVAENWSLMLRSLRCLGLAGSGA